MSSGQIADDDFLARTTARIESDSFAAEMNLANNVRLFVLFALRDPAVSALSRNTIRAELPTQVALRITALLASPGDRDFERSADTAVGCYLLALAAISPAVARTSAKQVLDVTRLFWAAAIARGILAFQASHVGTDTVVSSVFMPDRPGFYTAGELAVPSILKRATTELPLLLSSNVIREGKEKA
jgi:hypothetical protein